MISTNGGTWSTYKQEQNNKTKSFKFKAGEIVSVEFKSSKFSKNFKIL